MQISKSNLLFYAGVSCCIGGVLRVLAAFLPWDSGAPGLEILALMIDLALLYGVIGIYLLYAGALGLAGLIGFLLASAGIASIVGPDTQIAGLDTYRLGSQVIALGLLILSVQLLRAGALQVPAALWVFSVVAGAGGLLLGHEAQGFLVAGVLFGLGFLRAGLQMVRAQE